MKNDRTETIKRHIRKEAAFRRWAYDFYVRNGWLNVAVEKNLLFQFFKKRYPEQGRICTKGQFRQMVIAFCERNSYELNPNRVDAEDKRFKHKGKEYYLVTDDRFEADSIPRVEPNIT